MLTFRLALLSAVVGLPIVAAAQSGPYVAARLSFETFNELSQSIDLDGADANDPVGPVALDVIKNFTHGDALYTGTGTASSDFGTIRTFSRTDVSHQEDSPYQSQTLASGEFFDPLTIRDGFDGQALQATILLTGVGSLGGNGSQAHWQAGLLLNFYVQDPVTTNWHVSSQASLDLRDEDHAAGVDETLTVTLPNYDSTLHYALLASAYSTTSVVALPFDNAGDVPFAEFDASHTATITGLGFAGYGGNIVGVSGHVYPSAVPEPASFLALGLGGLALLRLRRK